jgi:hypothetical protein
MPEAVSLEELRHWRGVPAAGVDILYNGSYKSHEGEDSPKRQWGVGGSRGQFQLWELQSQILALSDGGTLNLERKSLADVVKALKQGRNSGQ